MSYEVDRKKLNFLERIYLAEVLRGLMITAGHFFRNIFFHILHLVGIAKKVRASATYQYPEERRPIPYRSRTRHRIVQRDDGSARCVACLMCETICPAQCIKIVPEEHPDPNIEKRPKSFEINLGKCGYCGICFEGCPLDAIRMDTHIVDTACYSRKAFTIDLPELLNPGSRIPEETPLERPHDPLA